MSRSQKHIREFETILRALELRGLDADMFLYVMTDLARHGEIGELFELCGRQVNQPGEIKFLRRAG